MSKKCQKVSKRNKTYEKCTELMQYNNFAGQSVSKRVKHSFRVKQWHSLDTHGVFQGRVGKTKHILAMHRPKEIRIAKNSLAILQNTP